METLDPRSLSPSQKVLAMEALWDPMCRDGDEPESPNWHGEVLAARRARIASGEARFVTLAELREHRVAGASGKMKKHSVGPGL